jgi:hypothetical protein
MDTTIILIVKILFHYELERPYKGNVFFCNRCMVKAKGVGLTCISAPWGGAKGKPKFGKACTQGLYIG